jgi:hypothetical protein
LQPWLGEALQLAAPKRGERILQVTGQSLAQSRALLDLVGDKGRVLLVEAERGQAEVIRELEHPALTVLAHTPEEGESFGLFDAMFACPLRMPDWPRERWGDLASNNLRPGGRFLIDLPAEDFCSSLEAAWLQAGGAKDSIACWTGPSESELVESLRAAGLRRIEASLGTHLMRSESPRQLAEGSAGILGAGPEMIESLHLALTEILGTAGAVELVCRRTRVKGMR